MLSIRGAETFAADECEAGSGSVVLGDFEAGAESFSSPAERAPRRTVERAGARTVDDRAGKAAEPGKKKSRHLGRNVCAIVFDDVGQFVRHDARKQRADAGDCGA